MQGNQVTSEVCQMFSVHFLNRTQLRAEVCSHAATENSVRSPIFYSEYELLPSGRRYRVLNIR